MGEDEGPAARSATGDVIEAARLLNVELVNEDTYAAPEQNGDDDEGGDNGELDEDKNALKRGGMISVCRSSLNGFLKRHFPIHAKGLLVMPVIPKVKAIVSFFFAFLNKYSKVLLLTPYPPPPQRDSLRRRINELQLPASALDSLIDRLGGKDNVAEMTGRIKRLVRVNHDGRLADSDFCSTSHKDEDEDDDGNRQSEEWWRFGKFEIETRKDPSPFAASNSSASASSVNILER